MAAVSHEAAHYMMCGMVYGTAGYSYIIILIVVTTIYIVANHDMGTSKK